MAVRPVWEGHLRLSLVSCPVALYNATSRAGDVNLHLINPQTGNRIHMVPVDPDAGEVERKDLVKGYELDDGEHVILTDEELKAVRLESARTIDIEKFVDLGDIDRLWWNDPYFMVPDGKAGIDAFIVIRDALREAKVVAIGRVTLHTRERLVAIEPRANGLVVTTLRSDDEVRDAAPLFNDIPARKADRQMVEIASQIISQQHGRFDPLDFKDRYEDALRELIASKQDGGGRGRPAPRKQPSNVINLMDALRQSLRQRGGSAVKSAGGKTASPSKAKPARRTRRAAG